MKKGISKEQLVGYWTIFTNIILVLTTFWLGLVVQDFVAIKNANVSATLARVEYINHVKPSVDTLNVHFGPFLDDINEELLKWQSYQNPGLFTAGVYATLFSRIDSIVDYYNQLIETSKDVVYYLDDVELVNNNQKKNEIKYIQTDNAQDLVDYLNKQSLITRIGVLYVYKEILDCCFVTDTITPNDNRNLGDWAKLEKRLISLYRSPDYIRTIGLTMNFRELIQELKPEYEKFYHTPNNDQAKLTFLTTTFNVALGIHNQLNDNRTYKQPEYNLWKMVIKSYWFILLIAVFITWLAFTIFVFRTAKLSSNNDIEKLQNKINSIEDLIEKTKKEANRQMETIKTKVDENERVTSTFQSSINHIQNSINKLENDLKSPSKEVKENQ